MDRSIPQIVQFIVNNGLDPLDLPQLEKKLWTVRNILDSIYKMKGTVKSRNSFFILRSIRLQIFVVITINPSSRDKGLVIYYKLKFVNPVIRIEKPAIYVRESVITINAFTHNRGRLPRKSGESWVSGSELGFEVSRPRCESERKLNLGAVESETEELGLGRERERVPG